jgi:hypothetical protein
MTSLRVLGPSRDEIMSWNKLIKRDYCVQVLYHRPQHCDVTIYTSIHQYKLKGTKVLGQLPEEITSIKYKPRRWV